MSDQVTTYYDASATRYRMSSTRRRHVITLLDRWLAAHPTQQCRILDIGFCAGEIGAYVRSKKDSRIHIDGIDISPDQVAAHAHEYDTARVVNIEAEDWALSLGRTYDLIIASELVEHLFRPDLFLGRLKKLLAPGGTVILTTPNLLLWSKRIKFLFGYHAYSATGLFEWGHIHLFSWRFLKHLLAENGYRIVDSYHILHPNALTPFQKMLPTGLFAYQFVLALQI